MVREFLSFALRWQGFVLASMAEAAHEQIEQPAGTRNTREGGRRRIVPRASIC
jgi:hypothetical protein